MAEMHFRLSDALMERLDALAGAWGLSRSGALRRLIVECDVDAVEPMAVPDMDELLAIASEKARSGNMSAVQFLAARQPDERQAELARLMARLGANHE
jgi:predicted DNA-binding protein